MKRVSDLILELQEFYQEHGDVPVMASVRANGDYWDLRQIRRVDARETKSLLRLLVGAEKLCVVEL